ncbi:hypothetical protein DINM_020425 [Dirofilaria immitis]|nr:hypothetical protein [Dirofilaria immitis]
MGAATSGLQSQMQQEHDPNAAFPWWVRFLAKALGVLGGFVAICFAVLGLLSFSATCIIAVLLQLAFGILTVALEAPFCCMFIDFIEKIAMFSESRKYWQKAALYCTHSLWFLGIGQKADLSSMGGTTDPAWNANVNQQQTPASFGNPSMA